MSKIAFQTPKTYILSPKKTMFVEHDVLHINTLTSMEAIAQLRLATAQKIRVSVYANKEKEFLDTEGIIEFCRLWKSDLHRESFTANIIPVVPCDYSACLVIASLGVCTIEVVLSHPIFETGVVQPIIFKHILQDAKTQFVAGGIFSPEDVQHLLYWGCVDVVQYQRDSL